MPVRKFRSIEEMNAAWEWLPAGDPEIGRKIRYLWNFTGAIHEASLKERRGAYKFRSIAEKNAFDDQREIERIARVRERVKQ